MGGLRSRCRGRPCRLHGGLRHSHPVRYRSSRGLGGNVLSRRLRLRAGGGFLPTNLKSLRDPPLTTQVDATWNNSATTTLVDSTASAAHTHHIDYMLRARGRLPM